MKRFCVVTILFILIVSAFIIPSFAVNSESCLINYTDQELSVSSYYDGFTYSLYNGRYNFVKKTSNYPENAFIIVTKYDPAQEDTSRYHLVWLVFDNDDYASIPANPIIYLTYTQNAGISPSKSNFSVNNTYNLRYFQPTTQLTYITTKYVPVFNTIEDGLAYVRHFIDSGGSNAYQKNENVDEFIANTLISMGITFNSYSDALPVAQSAWNYLIDENNWYIGSGDRNDKDIKWNIDNAVSYANAQSNNYLDWYNGYKVNKDLTVALTKFIGDNYTASTLGQGTLAGYSVYYNSSYSYGSSGGSSGFDGTFGSSPNALSFYPASTITYFNGTYLHDNDVIDLDEFVYSPADVRKFIAYPDASGTIIPPSDSSGSGVITDDNGDTVYNIDLDWPSLDWLADAIQAVLDFLNRLITTIADFLTQILDAILSLFSDAFESLTEFGQGIIEWLYSVIGNLGTLGSNYIPSDLWTIILPFIYLNVGIAILMFVLRSH